MKSKSLALAALVLVACEGEPPKTPVGALVLPTAAASAAATATEEPASEPSSAPASASGALPPCACACNCGAVAAADGGVSAQGNATPAAAAAAPIPAAAPASISGSVATTPKAAAANAVVYLEDAPIDPHAKMTASVTNRVMTFVPFIAVVPVGGKIVFRNDDPFPHNVFSPDGERFNIGVIPQHAATARVFKNAGAYAILCNLHPGMLGYVIAAPSSYFAKTDAQGHFVIKSVPPGTYKVTAWAPRQQPVTQSVTVKDGDASINFELHR
jgi:plastocyanin